MRPGAATAVVLAALGVALLAGCGLGAGKTSGEATLTVTRNFGSTELGKVVVSRPNSAETAMRQLERAYKVDTSYAGRFVKGIDGVKGGNTNGRPVDWFYFVNGIEAPIGAADTTIHAGDSVWWDFRDWGAATHAPAVVGAWPHPFTGSAEGKRPAVRIICAPGADAACAMVERRLADEGVPAARGMSGSAGKGSGLRVLVGLWKELRPDPAAQLLEEGPASSGVYLKPSPAGNSVALLDPTGAVVKQESGSVGFVAATLIADGLPTWIVSGTDVRALAGAAQRLTEKDLHLHYSVAWVGGQAVPAPLTARN